MVAFPDSSSPRDYNLGCYGIPEGAPKVLKLLNEPIGGAQIECPTCSCETLAEIEVTLPKITFPGLEGRSGTGSYLGCPACPWASPMVIMVADK
jgi:hypothetical protein